MLNRLRAHRVSFQHAFDGFIHVFKAHPNFRFHLFATFCAGFFGVYFRINTMEWLILVFTVNMVLVAEMINTAIESMVDLITMEHRQDAKIAKDVSAAMVLVSATFAIVVGMFIFLPKIITYFS